MTDILDAGDLPQPIKIEGNGKSIEVQPGIGDWVGEIYTSGTATELTKYHDKISGVVGGVPTHFIIQNKTVPEGDGPKCIAAFQSILAPGRNNLIFLEKFKGITGLDKIKDEEMKAGAEYLGSMMNGGYVGTITTNMSIVQSYFAQEADVPYFFAKDTEEAGRMMMARSYGIQDNYTLEKPIKNKEYKDETKEA